jgi:hypothetical protein
MYRLICPIIDDVCATNGLEPYFEFSRPNGPNRRLSADIALMCDDRPVWLVEAKKYGRKIDPGMIDAYLMPGMMGAVSNGNEWIFKIDGRFLHVDPLLRTDGYVDEVVYAQIRSILSSIDQASAIACSDAWTTIWQSRKRAAGPTLWVSNGGKGERAYHQKNRFDTLAEAATAARGHTPNGTMAARLLDEILSTKQELSVGYLEVNEARMIWWTGNRVRGARLNLTGNHLELLVHNTLLDAIGRENIRASIKMHDKNTAMSVLKASIPEELVGLPSLFGITP